VIHRQGEGEARAAEGAGGGVERAVQAVHDRFQDFAQARVDG